MTPLLGDIWMEVDQRFSRHVMVICDHGGPQDCVQIQTMYRAPETIDWRPASSRRSWAKVSRFNGKRGGYELVVRSTMNRK